MNIITGWLLDLYTHPETGMTQLWIIQTNGKRTCVQHSFPGIFYVSSNEMTELSTVKDYVYARFAEKARVEVENIKHPLKPDGKHLLGIHTNNMNTKRRLFKALADQFPNLDYYNVDIDIAPLYAATFGTFSFCRLELQISGDVVQEIQVKESPWELDLEDPPLRILNLSLNRNPNREQPTQLTLSYKGKTSQFKYSTNRQLALYLGTNIRRIDPDIIMTDFGDCYLIKALLDGAKDFIEPIPINRDPTVPIRTRQAKSFHAYGQTINRPEAVYLAGRQHIDIQAAFFWRETELTGLMEAARVTGQTLQNTARTTPGTGISAMQAIEALRSNILVLYQEI